MELAQGCSSSLPVSLPRPPLPCMQPSDTSKRSALTRNGLAGAAGAQRRCGLAAEAARRGTVGARRSCSAAQGCGEGGRACGVVMLGCEGLVLTARQAGRIVPHTPQCRAASSCPPACLRRHKLRCPATHLPHTARPHAPRAALQLLELTRPPFLRPPAHIPASPNFFTAAHPWCAACPPAAAAAAPPAARAARPAGAGGRQAATPPACPPPPPPSPAACLQMEGVHRDVQHQSKQGRALRGLAPAVLLLQYLRKRASGRAHGQLPPPATPPSHAPASSSAA